MTRRMLLVFTFLLGAVLSTAGFAAAQGANIDIAAVSEVVLAADPEAVAAGLETPPDDADLPEGYVNPASGTPENAEIAEALVLPVGDLDGAVASVNHAFDVDPDVVPGLISAGYINYVVAAEEITEDELDDFEEGASSSFEEDTTGVAGSVSRIELGGVEAVVITVVTEEAGISAVVHLVAVPVGHTLVIGTALVAEQGTVDPDDVLPFAEALTLAGVAYLETVAEEAQ